MKHHIDVYKRQTQKLLIQTKKEWLALIQDLDQSYEYTFMINEAFALESLPEKETCICFDAVSYTHLFNFF